MLCLLGLATTPALGAELTGTVQVAGRPAQHAVVWLAASGAPAGPAKKVVLDQRNLAVRPARAGGEGGHDRGLPQQRQGVS